MRDSKTRLPLGPVDGRALLELGRSSSENALARLRHHTPEQLAGALLELAPPERAEFLETAERADEIVPLLPETELTNTIREAGIEEFGWLIGFASPEQRVAAIDLDCWQGFRFSPTRLFEWIDALIAAGPETLAAAFDEFDPELWVIALREMGEFTAFGIGTVDPEEGLTEDGIVFYEGFTAEDEDRIGEILRTALVYAPSSYGPLAYGAVNADDAASSESAARWKRNRLLDLGFPDRDQAMRAYKPLRAENAPTLWVDRDPKPGLVLQTADPTPVQLVGSLLKRALAELAPARAREMMGYVVAVANSLAVADNLPFSKPETTKACLARAVAGIDRGIAELARVRGQAPGTVLDTTAPLDLFRIGATLQPELGRRMTLADLEAEEENSDWGRKTEEIAEEDRTVGSDGRLR